MVNRRFQAVCSLIAFVLLSQPLLAWDDFGHMVVAGLAYRNLDSKTRTRVNKLLALNPYYKIHWATMIPAGTARSDRKRLIFMLAATWADAIKRDPVYHNDGEQGGNRPAGPEAARNTGYDDFNRHKYWHFIDLPFSQDGTNVSELAAPAPNAGTQIAAFRTILRSRSASNKLKSYDLVWLLHVVGDVHQPLHCATRVSAAHPEGDAGGNDEIFCDATAAACTGRLHAFWDDILGTSDDVGSADKYAAGLDMPAASPSDVADAKTWIQASFALAQTNVYVKPVMNGDGPFRATAEYTDAARKLARQQVALAGARLSELLKEDLKR
jgi:S1/P1 Nuclease